MCRTLTMKTQPKTLAFNVETVQEKTLHDTHENDQQNAVVLNVESAKPARTTDEETETVDDQKTCNSKSDGEMVDNEHDVNKSRQDNGKGKSDSESDNK